jgi:hypothetical protein
MIVVVSHPVPLTLGAALVVLRDAHVLEEPTSRDTAEP